MQEAIRKADVLIEALPYIKNFHNKVVVIKYGGSILGEDKIRKGVLEDIVFLNFMGLKPVLVHGGGPNISDRLRQAGVKTEFVDGMRVTDESILKVVEEELQARKVTERAKGILMRENNMSEEDAFKKIQRQSMDMRKSMREIAEAIILIDNMKKK